MNNEANNKAADESYDNMSTLSACMTSVLKKGYTENFRVTNEGMEGDEKDKAYAPQQVSIDNFYRFEGSSNPSDNAILYVVQTSDGKKGTLVDAYGSDADEKVASFIKEVEQINKQEAQ